MEPGGARNARRDHDRRGQEVPGGARNSHEGPGWSQKEPGGWPGKGREGLERSGGRPLGAWGILKGSGKENTQNSLEGLTILLIGHENLYFGVGQVRF